MTHDTAHGTPSPGARVLLVEGRAAACFALLRGLTELGFLVDVATDTDQARRRIATRAYGIVAAELHVGPSRDPQGLGILHLARDLLPGTKTVLLVNDGRLPGGPAPASLGVDCVLPATLPPAEAVRALAELADRR